MFQFSETASAVADQVAMLDAPLPQGCLSGWVDAVEQTQVLINQLTALQTVALARVAATEDVLLEDGTVAEESRPIGHVRMDAPGLVSDLLGVSEQVAGRRVRQSARMASCMPALVEAMASGRLDGYRAQVVVEELEDAPTGDARAVTDALADRLGSEVPGPLRQRTRRVISRLAPDVLRRRAEKARIDRGLTRFTDLFGTDQWEGRFPVERARPAWAAVDELARQLRADGECATLEQARADALLQLVLGQATVEVSMHVAVPDDPSAGGGDEGPGPAAGEGPSADGPSGDGPASDGRPDVGEEGTWGVDGGDEGPGRAAGEGPSADGPSGDGPASDGRPDVGDGGAFGSDAAPTIKAAGGCLVPPNGPGAPIAVRGFGIPGETFLSASFLAGLVGEAHRVQMRCHPGTGSVLAMEELAGRVLEREGYRPSAALVALVRTRDGRCRFPGCGIAARFTDLDHVRAWPDGPTSTGNLICLCRRHHRVKQRPGWRARLHPDGRVTWTDPTGRVRTTWPIDQLGASLPDGRTPSDAVGPTAPDRSGLGSVVEGANPVVDDTEEIVARHGAAMAAAKALAEEHPFRECTDERGWTWTDDEAFSMLEDAHHLWVRQSHARNRRQTAAHDDRRHPRYTSYPAVRRLRWADLAPPPF